MVHHHHSERDHYLLGLAPLSLLVCVIELAAGFLSGSLALITDGFHSGIDYVENRLNAYIAHRATLVSNVVRLRKWGFAISLLLIGITSGLMLYEAILKLAMSTTEVLPLWTPAIAAFALAVGLRQLWLHLKVPKAYKNINHWAQWLHLITDVAASITALIGTGLSHMRGFECADSWAVIGIVGIIWLRIFVAIYEVYIYRSPTSNPRWHCRH